MTKEKPTKHKSYKYIPAQDRVTLHPIIGVRANAQDHGAGWRFWIVCRMLDAQNGSGVVEMSVVSEYLKKHGMNTQQIKRWMNDACKMGFVKTFVRRTGVTILFYSSEAKVAVKLGCDRVDVRYVEMDIAQILGKKWRSEVWVAFVGDNFNGKTISRERLQQITGIERHQQRRLENGTNIRNTRNVVITDQDADASTLTAMKECQGKAVYTYKGKVVFRLPDTRIVEGIDTYGRKRSKRINEKIAAINEKSGYLEQEASFERSKLFHVNQENAYEYVEKSFSKNDDWEVFYVAPEQQGDYTRGVIWQMMRKEVDK